MVSTADDLAAFEFAFLSLLSGDTPAVDRDFSEVVRQSGLPEAELTELAELGVIEIKNARGKRRLDYRDAAIVEHWGRIRSLGYSAETGYDAGFLKRYADAVKPLASAELDMFLKAFGDTTTAEAARLASRGIEVANEILTRMHTRALTRGLSERVGTGKP